MIFIMAGSWASLILVELFIQWRRLEFVTWCTKYRPQWPPNTVMQQWKKIAATGNFDAINIVLWVLISMSAVILVHWAFRQYKPSPKAIQKVQYTFGWLKKLVRWAACSVAILSVTGLILWALWVQADRVGFFPAAQVQCQEWLSYIPVRFREIITGLCAIVMASTGWISFSTKWNGKIGERLRLFGVAACFGLVVAFFSTAAVDKVNGVVQIDSKLIPHSVQ